MSADPASPYSRKNPFPAAHPVNRKLSGEGSGKDTRHHEISLAGSGLSYEVGDSLGLFATNNPALVAEIIAAIGATGDETVPGPQATDEQLQVRVTQPEHAGRNSLLRRLLAGDAECLRPSVRTAPIRRGEGGRSAPLAGRLEAVGNAGVGLNLQALFVARHHSRHCLRELRDGGSEVLD